MKKKSLLIAVAFLAANCGIANAEADLFPPARETITENEIALIVDAIYRAEGDDRAKKPFGILSVPCDGYAECRTVCANTVRNNYQRWRNAGTPGEFIEFLGRRYCPVGAKNDNGMNKYWIKNVKWFLSHFKETR